jgi:hypothetical protein
MARSLKRHPARGEDDIAKLGAGSNTSRKSYNQTAGMTEEEIRDLGRDIAADNARAAAFYEKESRGEDPFRDDGSALAPWWRRSPWATTAWKDDLILDWIRICGWHFKETGNPVFAFRAWDLSRILSPQIISSRHPEAMAWFYEYLDDAAKGVLAAVDQSPKGKEQPGITIAKALGFPMGKNANPLREARAIMRNDEIYIGVRRLIDWGSGVTEAFTAVAETGVASFSTVRSVYYRIRSLAKKRRPFANAAPLVNSVRWLFH